MSTTTTREVTVTERRALHGAIDATEMTREEEIVLRMRHGVAAPRSMALSYRGQSDPELSAKLALIEADLLSRTQPTHAPEHTEADAVEAALIERLKQL